MQLLPPDNSRERSQASPCIIDSQHRIQSINLNHVHVQQPGDIMGHEVCQRFDVHRFVWFLQIVSIFGWVAYTESAPWPPMLLQFMGIVFEVGPNVKTLKKGDRVVACFDIG